MPKLTDIAFPFKTDNDTIHWQHEITAQVFKTVELANGKLHLYILQVGGQWQDNGSHSEEELTKLAGNLN